MFHKASVVLHLALAVAAGFLMAPALYSLSLSYVTKDAVLSSKETIFAPAERVMVDVDIRWLFVGLLVPGIIYSLLLLTRWRPAYEKAVQGRIYLWRWVYLGVVMAMMLKLASVVSGVEDILVLKTTAALVFLGAAFAWFSERQNEKVRQPVQSAFVLFLLANLLAWGPLLGSLLGTLLYGLVRLPWYAYALSAVVVLSFVGLAVNLYLSNKQSGKWKTYTFVERNYVLIALLSQLAFVAIAILGFRR